MSAARRTLVGLALAGIFVALPARADIGPPPTCPPGLQHQYHYGHYCAPIACDGPEATCGGSMTCAKRAYCLVNRDRSGAVPEWQYAGSCERGQKCGEGATCVVANFCSPDPAPPASALPASTSPAASTSASVAPSTTPSSTASAARAEPSSSPPPAVAPAKHGCGCEIPGGRGSRMAGAFALAATAGVVLGVLRRRDRRG